MTIIPDLQWGGDGIMGCDAATGILHRVPQLAANTFKPARYDAGTPSSSSSHD